MAISDLRKTYTATDGTATQVAAFLVRTAQQEAIFGKGHLPLQEHAPPKPARASHAKLIL